MPGVALEGRGGRLLRRGCSRRGEIFGGFGRFAGLSGEWWGIGGLVWVSQGGCGRKSGEAELRGVGGDSGPFDSSVTAVCPFAEALRQDCEGAWGCGCGGWLAAPGGGDLGGRSVCGGFLGGGVRLRNWLPSTGDSIFSRGALTVLPLRPPLPRCRPVNHPLWRRDAGGRRTREG